MHFGELLLEGLPAGLFRGQSAAGLGRQTPTFRELSLELSNASRQGLLGFAERFLALSRLLPGPVHLGVRAILDGSDVGRLRDPDGLGLVLQGLDPVAQGRAVGLELLSAE